MLLTKILKAISTVEVEKAVRVSSFKSGDHTRLYQLEIQSK